MTNLIEDITVALQNIQRRKLRSFLTILAIVVGMTAVVMFVTLGLGIQNGVNQQFQMMGADKIFVTPSSSFMDFGGTTSKLTDKDINTIESAQGIKRTTKMVYGMGKITYKDESTYSFVMGMPPEEGLDLVESMAGFKVDQGRFSKDEEKDKIVVGWGYTYGGIFEKPVKIGSKLDISGKTFEVVGSLTQIGNPSDDSQLYITLTAAQDMFNKKDEYDYVIAQTMPGANTSDVAEKVKDELRKERDVEKGSEDFSVQTQEDLKQAFDQVLGVLFIAIVGIASISLLVGGVGIMNTMYTSVLDRTQEIGVLKAIGATDEDVMSVFVIESGLLGLVGGIIGIVIGLALSYIIEYIAINYLQTTLIKVYLDPVLLGGILLFSFVIGSISGLLPARRAAKMRPAEALRYE